MATIGIPKEIAPHETRVAAMPETVAKMIKAGMKVQIERGAGLTSCIADTHYQNAGAVIIKDANQLYQTSSVILKVQPPCAPDEMDLLQADTCLIAPFIPTEETPLITTLKQKHIAAFSLMLLPRIARAQSMDILSSMNNLAGYKSVITAAHYSRKIFPMLTTAAGTIIPAKVIVIGAGVAGLQAIATAHRLGAVVTAFDTRPAAEEQVKSLGASFVRLETAQDMQDKDGYAKEQSAEFYAHEQAAILPHLKEADVVITTALIPGKRAPLLITDAMVKQMKRGAVIIDLAIEHQGNCELALADQVVTKYGVTILGLANLACLMPAQASPLFAKNMLAFLQYIAPQLEAHQFDMHDDIIKNTLVTQKGNVVHPSLAPFFTEGQPRYAT